MLVLELNDAGLRLSDGAQVMLCEPGFASVDGAQIMVGEAARRLARLQPRLSHSRYWYQLDQAPLDRVMASARSTADLAYWQLQQLREAAAGQPLLLAVPSSFEADQLGLLLGLCRAAELGAVGLVDAAVAAASTEPHEGVVLHVDLQLHRVWMTRLEVAGFVARGSSHDLAKPGLMAVWDTAATVIAEAFVHQTRVDPLHSAASEQLLYDELPGWLAQLQRAPVASLSFNVRGRSHRISLARDALVTALAPMVNRITQALRADVDATPGAQVALSDRAAAIPGLVEALTEAMSRPPQLLDSLATARGALTHVDRIRSGAEALPWVTRLPASDVVSAVPVAVAAPQSPAGPPPTHLLLGDEAISLHDTASLAGWGLSLQIDAAGLPQLRAAPDLWLNGAAVTADTSLALGDRLAAQGREWRLIRVVGLP